MILLAPRLPYGRVYVGSFGAGRRVEAATLLINATPEQALCEVCCGIIFDRSTMTLGNSRLCELDNASNVGFGIIRLHEIKVAFSAGRAEIRH